MFREEDVQRPGGPSTPHSQPQQPELPTFLPNPAASPSGPTGAETALCVDLSPMPEASVPPTAEPLSLASQISPCETQSPSDISSHPMGDDEIARRMQKFQTLLLKGVMRVIAGRPENPPAFA